MGTELVEYLFYCFGPHGLITYGTYDKPHVGRQCGTIPITLTPPAIRAGVQQTVRLEKLES